MKSNSANVETNTTEEQNINNTESNETNKNDGESYNSEEDKNKVEAPGFQLYLSIITIFLFLSFFGRKYQQ